MTMIFRTLKDSIITILGAAEASRYQTIGFQRQVKSADEVLDLNRFVQVFYDSGNFPKSGGSISGPVSHLMTFNIEFTISKSVEGDLSSATNESASAASRSTAILAFQEASKLADDSMDELFDIIYQVLMDARNIDLGLTAGIIADRWIDQFQKDKPIPQGEYVILTGSCQLTCRTSEAVVGDEGTPGAKIYDTVVDIDGDDVEKTGITIDQN